MFHNVDITSLYFLITLVTLYFVSYCVCVHLQLVIVQISKNNFNDSQSEKIL